jgi:hypothetical protein
MAQNGIKLSAESLECLIWRAEGRAAGTHLARCSWVPILTQTNSSDGW